jgi:putative membrane protein
MHRPGYEFVLSALLVVAGVGQSAIAAEPAPTAPQVSFLTAAAQAGMLEIEAARTALAVSGRTSVKEYAYRLIYDYEKMNADVAAIAQKLGISLPTALDAQHAAVLQSLRDTPAQAFDMAYVTQVIQDHEKAAGLLHSNLLNSSTELAVFASYNLPGTRARKVLAEELKAALAK